MGELEEVADRLALDAEVGVGRAGGRRGSHQHVAVAASALCRHRGGVDHYVARPCTDRRGLHRRASRPVRLCHAGTRIGGGGGLGGSDRSGRGGARNPVARREPRVRRRRSTACAMFTGDAEHDAPVFDRAGSAGGRSHRRARAGARGQRDDRRRARLDGGDHHAGPHDAAADRTNGDACGGRQRQAGPGAAGAVQQPVHERGGTDRARCCRTPR